MTTLREAAQQALEALEDHAKQYPHMQKGYTVDATSALRAALEQPEQAPVAWHSVGATSLEFETECADETRFLNVAEMPSHAVRWRIVSPPRREWQSLTDEDKLAIAISWGTVAELIENTEAKLKERNHG